MKTMKPLLAMLALAATTAAATSRDDYAAQWPLSLSEPDAGAYRVVLDRAVYAHAHQAALRDLQVFNARGEAVPTALFGAQAPLALPVRRVDVPWFALPAGRDGDVSGLHDLTAVVRRDAAGTVLSVGSTAGLAVDPAAVANPVWLLDLGAQAGQVAALSFRWTPGDAPLDLAYRLEGSDDLREWRVLDTRVRLVDLRNRGHRLRQDRIEVRDGLRYLRLVPLQGTPAPVLEAVQAELEAAAAPADWRWERLSGRAVRDADGGTHYEFALGGRFPMERADIDAAGNDAREWLLSSRDAADAPWRPQAAPWVAFAAGAERSQPQPLYTATRDRYWRLSPVRGQGLPPAAPALRLGYRPETVVFMAQGDAPYALAAGSARAMRADAPLAQLVDAIRVRRGPAWQPVSATLGAMQSLAADALTPPAPVRDWKAWLLWALLIGGALLVSGFAFSLLRRREA